MADFKIAHRYAKSLLELAESKGVLEEVHTDIQNFTELHDNSRELNLLLRNPIVKHQIKRVILKKIFDGKVNPLTAAFFQIVSIKNRESSLPEIAKEFHVIYNSHKGIESARVTTAAPLTPEIRREFEKILKSISDKETIELSEEVNEDLIGGYILKVGDRQIDDSVSGKLNSLRKELIVNI